MATKNVLQDASQMAGESVQHLELLMWSTVQQGEE